MPSLSQSAPIFAVGELSRAIHFYTHTLGFTLHMQTTDPMPYAILVRDGVSVHLTIDDVRKGKGAMYAIVDDVDALHQELTAQGAHITEPPDDRVYGMRDMYLHDESGNLLGFGQPLG